MLQRFSSINVLIKNSSYLLQITFVNKQSPASPISLSRFSYASIALKLSLELYFPFKLFNRPKVLVQSTPQFDISFKKTEQKKHLSGCPDETNVVISNDD